MKRPLLYGLVLVGATVIFTVPLFAVREKSVAEVNVHGVDYSGTAFSYYVVDPDKPSESGAGEMINAYSAGGTVCCVGLPKKWHPGIKLQVRTTHWLDKLPDGSLPEVKNITIITVPQYSDGSPGELWVLRGADEKISVVSSDFQPDHPQWPGAVKGWPVPSLEYRRARWEIYRNHEDNGVRLYVGLLEDLAKSPQTSAAEAWESAQKYDEESIKGFTGPNDPEYVKALKKEYEEGLIRSRRLLKQVMEQKP